MLSFGLNCIEAMKLLNLFLFCFLYIGCYKNFDGNHLALREVDPTFDEELINYERSKKHMLNLSHFRDDASSSDIV